eukprot:3518068-Prymnesium_polylepis.1
MSARVRPSLEAPRARAAQSSPHPASAATTPGRYLARWTKASAMYAAGLVLYTTGYYAFAVLYGLGASGPLQGAWLKWVAATTYSFGAGCFILGSACLAADSRTAHCRGPSALPVFWGSLFFLVGSFAFEADATFQLVHRAARPAKVASDTVVVFGYAVFVLGR